jgi:hypothetical protein
LRLPTTLLYSSLAKRFRRGCTKRTTVVGLEGVDTSQQLPVDFLRLRVERLYRDPFLQRFPFVAALHRRLVRSGFRCRFIGARESE